MLNVNFNMARRAPDRDSIKDAINQTDLMMGALFQADTRVELQVRIGRRDPVRMSVAAEHLAERARDYYINEWDRDVRLYVGVESPRDIMEPVGSTPTTSFLRPSVSALVVTFHDRQAGLIQAIRLLQIAPKAIVEAGKEVSAIWRLDQLISRDTAQGLATAIGTRLAPSRRVSSPLEIPLPGFPIQGHAGNIGTLTTLVYATVC